MFIASTSTGSLPTPCTASLWKSTPRSRVILPISASGWIVPISLLANMIVTRTVLSVIALRTSSGSTRPYWSTGRYVTVARPLRSSARQVSRIALCSVTCVMTWLPLSR